MVERERLDAMVFDVSARQWIDVCFRELDISGVKKYGLTKGIAGLIGKKNLIIKRTKCLVCLY